MQLGSFAHCRLLQSELPSIITVKKYIEIYLVFGAIVVKTDKLDQWPLILSRISYYVCK